MAKKKKITKHDALNELKTLESKWLKDRRLDPLTPIQVKVIAAKAAALLELIEVNDMPVDVTSWPLAGAEELVKIDETPFKRAVNDLQKIGVVNSSYKLKKAAVTQHADLDLKSEEGILAYRCVKPGGVSLSDLDEYILEDQEVTYTEEAIGGSQSLQTAIANEWLVRIEQK